MTSNVITVTSAEQLLQALKTPEPFIVIQGTIQELSAFTLPTSGTLKGEADALLQFKAGQPGVSLGANTRLESIRIETDEAVIAVALADEEEDFGEIHVHDVTTVGRFHLERVSALKGKIHLRNIHVKRADARMAVHRAVGYGVEVVLGAITIYNFSKNSESLWQLKAENISCGSAENPVRGSGVYVFGGDYIPMDADLSTAPAPTQVGGKIEVELVSTGEIHTDGGIAAGVPNLITGGVFLGSGTHAKKVQNNGLVNTYGVNDMVLDNWGICEQWIAHEKITSYNSSGIGFVNFGVLVSLQILSSIETHGVGARGFSLYDGQVESAVFQNITTHGDGAIGIQLSKPFGSITVREGIRTTGGEGESVVRGKMVHLKAHALSLKPGVKGNSLIVKGKVIAEKQGIPIYEFATPASNIITLQVDGVEVVES